MTSDHCTMNTFPTTKEKKRAASLDDKSYKFCTASDITLAHKFNGQFTGQHDKLSRYIHPGKLSRCTLFNAYHCRGDEHYCCHQGKDQSTP